jgi:hypothetical protein
MMLKRQIHLLAFLRALGGQAAAVDFQKLLLLYSKEEATPTFEFVPDRFGAFSFTSYTQTNGCRRLNLQLGAVRASRRTDLL